MEWKHCPNASIFLRCSPPCYYGMDTVMRKRRSRWLHPQKCLVPFPAPEPYPTTVLAIPALASICAILCSTRCPTLQRCPWGPGTMTCLESSWQLELKKFPIHAVYRSCCVQEDIGMNVSTNNQAQGSLESLLVT